MGLDWAKIRQDYEAKASPEELAPIDWVDKPKRIRKSRAKGTRNYVTGSRKKSFDYEAVVRAYKDGLTSTEIAAEFGCSTSTVRLYARQAGCYDPNRDKGGSESKEVCSRGHVYEEVGFYVGKKGGKDCKACKRERWREKHGLQQAPLG